MFFSVVDSIARVITVLKCHWKCLGHNKSIEDVKSTIQYLGRRAAGNGICNLYEKPSGEPDASVIRMLEELSRQTRLVNASSPVKTLGWCKLIYTSQKLLINNTIAILTQ